MAEIQREMLHAALDELAAAYTRIASLEAQLRALKLELQRYVAMRVGDD